MASMTIYASEYGDIQSSNNNLTTMRNGSSLALYTANGTDTRVGIAKIGTPYYGWQSFFKYDLTVIPSGSTINSVSQSYDITAKGASAVNTIHTALIADIGTVTTADWLDAAALTAVHNASSTLLFNPINATTSIGSGYTATQLFTRAADAVTANIGGSISTVMWANRMRAGSTPSSDESVDFANVGLVVDYTPPPSDDIPATLIRTQHYGPRALTGGPRGIW